MYNGLATGSGRCVRIDSSIKYLEDALARLFSESFDLLSKIGPLKGSQNRTDFFSCFY